MESCSIDYSFSRDLMHYYSLSGFAFGLTFPFRKNIYILTFKNAKRVKDISKKKLNLPVAFLYFSFCWRHFKITI